MRGAEGQVLAAGDDIKYFSNGLPPEFTACPFILLILLTTLVRVCMQDIE